jgi:hypothetical protein
MEDITSVPFLTKSRQVRTKPLDAATSQRGT